MVEKFGVNYLLNDKDLHFEGGLIKALSKLGYFCIGTGEQAKLRGLIFAKKKEATIEK